MPMTEEERGDYWHKSYLRLQAKYDKVVEENQRLKKLTGMSYYVIDLVGSTPSDIEAVAVGPYGTEHERDNAAAELARMVGKHAIDKGISSLLTATIDEGGVLQVGTYLMSEINEWFEVTPNPKGV